jgi:tRNA pseudouridine38-40 synthase
MERYQVILAYDGSEFQGFQRQAKSRTVQGVVEDALRKLGWQGRVILAAGRTDTGVHASGQVIAFDLEWPHSEQALLQALNANLPPAIAAQRVRQVSADFHPRYSALWRRYTYQVICQPARQPLLERYTWRVWPAVDARLLQAVASDLTGTYNFAAFGTPLKSSSHAKGSTVRTVYRAVWIEQPPWLVFEITANAFLYHMVRRLVHVQVMIGQGLLPKEALQDALGSPESAQDDLQPPLVHGLAPAHGLTLVEVGYPPELLTGEG